MVEIYLGAYSTEQEALDSLSVRSEPKEQLIIVQDGDIDFPWRIKWLRPN